MLQAGCAGGTIGTLANAALQMAGVAKPPPELPDAQKPPRNVSIRLHAAQRINTDAAGPVAGAGGARIYKLRPTAAFEQAHYDGFADAQRAKKRRWAPTCWK